MNKFSALSAAMDQRMVKAAQMAGYNYAADPRAMARHNAAMQRAATPVLPEDDAAVYQAEDAAMQRQYALARASSRRGGFWNNTNAIARAGLWAPVRGAAAGVNEAFGRLFRNAGDTYRGALGLENPAPRAPVADPNAAARTGEVPMPFADAAAAKRNAQTVGAAQPAAKPAVPVQQSGPVPLPYRPYGDPSPSTDPDRMAVGGTFNTQANAGTRDRPAPGAPIQNRATAPAQPATSVAGPGSGFPAAAAPSFVNPNQPPQQAAAHQPFASAGRLNTPAVKDYFAQKGIKYKMAAAQIRKLPQVILTPAQIDSATIPDREFMSSVDEEATGAPVAPTSPYGAPNPRVAPVFTAESGGNTNAAAAVNAPLPKPIAPPPVTNEPPIDVSKAAELNEGARDLRDALRKVASKAKPVKPSKPSHGVISGDVAAAGAGGIGGSVLGSGIALLHNPKGIDDDQLAAKKMIEKSLNPDDIGAAFRRLKTPVRYAIPMGIGTAALAVLLKRKYGVQDA